MDLFSELESDKNYLPKDGLVRYYGSVLAYDKARSYLSTFLEKIPWQHELFTIAGKRIVTKRKIAWYGDKESYLVYFNTTKQVHIWTFELLELKRLVEEISGEVFNSCLLNLYPSGEDGLGWHSDSEKGAVASLSLGATRKFAFKHKETQEKVIFDLISGDLLVMKGETQENWLHSVLPSKKVKEPRVNLTFRNINLKF